MPQTIYAVLNAANNFRQEVNLTAPVEEDFVRILANYEALVYASFLSDGYIFQVTNNAIRPQKGVALAGSKLSFSVKLKPFYNFVIELYDKTNAEELQIAMYFFS